MASHQTILFSKWLETKYYIIDDPPVFIIDKIIPPQIYCCLGVEDELLKQMNTEIERTKL